MACGPNVLVLFRRDCELRMNLPFLNDHTLMVLYVPTTCLSFAFGPAKPELFPIWSLMKECADPCVRSE